MVGLKIGNALLVDAIQQLLRVAVTEFPSNLNQSMDEKMVMVALVMMVLVVVVVVVVMYILRKYT